MIKGEGSTADLKREVDMISQIIFLIKYKHYIKSMLCIIYTILCIIYIYNIMGLPRWLSGKESTSQYRRLKRCRFNPWVRKIPWRKKWQPTPIFLPEKSHGQGSLAGYSPWG